QDLAVELHAAGRDHFLGVAAGRYPGTREATCNAIGGIGRRICCILTFTPAGMRCRPVAVLALAERRAVRAVLVAGLALAVELADRALLAARGTSGFLALAERLAVRAVLVEGLAFAVELAERALLAALGTSGFLALAERL